MKRVSELRLTATNRNLEGFLIFSSVSTTCVSIASSCEKYGIEMGAPGNL